MKNLLIGLIIICSICISSITASANMADEQRRARQRQAEIENFSAAAINTNIPSEVFRKAEKYIRDLGSIPKSSLWVACAYGFVMFFEFQDDWHGIIIAWDGKIVHSSDYIGSTPRNFEFPKRLRSKKLSLPFLIPLCHCAIFLELLLAFFQFSTFAYNPRKLRQ